LRTLAGVLLRLTARQHVGLHNLPLQTQLMPTLGEVLMSLPPSVKSLSLWTAPSVKRHDVDSLQRLMLFKAIGLVSSLRELHIPNLEDIVGTDRACMKPLSHLPYLEVVYTKESSNLAEAIQYLSRQCQIKEGIRLDGYSGS
jgi:hypothetical protein